jgi:hypothetical protein
MLGFMALQNKSAPSQTTCMCLAHTHESFPLERPVLIKLYILDMFGMHAHTRFGTANEAAFLIKLDMFDIHTHTYTHTHCKGPLRCLYLDVNIYVANMYVKAECM